MLIPFSVHALNILLPLPFNHGFDYISDEPISVGTCVEVPFRHKILLGVVTETAATHPHPKPIHHVFSDWHLTANNLRFLKWVADYTLSPLGAVLKMMLPVQHPFKKIEPLLPFEWNPTTPHLSVAQKEAAEMLLNTGIKPIVLEGVTGSGKTEVYFESIAEHLLKGRQILVLLPEISLSHQWFKRFEKRFGFAPLLWHSELGLKDRRLTWQKILRGDTQVVVGARSALFLPFKNLGLIVVDEEHDATYKQENGVLYNARDMAIVLGHIEKCPVILSSATPSLETLFNIDNGKYAHQRLCERYHAVNLPHVHVTDMRGTKSGWISATLHSKIKETLDRQEQSLLFLNRRGYAPLTLCHLCGERITCPSCSTWLVYHKSKESLQCHHCGYRISFPKNCPTCHEEGTLIPCGPGVERLAEEVTKLFPEARLEVMTSDTLGSHQTAQDILNKIQNRQIDLIVGTQVMAKGHHFPYLTLVGVIDADLGLGGGDLRSAERTYQLLQQVSGRAGREYGIGQVVIQSYMPDHPVIQGDHEQFLEKEKSSRKIMGMPPFGRLAAVILSAKTSYAAEAFALKLSKICPRVQGIDVMGPAPSPLHKLRTWYRWRFLVRTHKNVDLQKYIQQWLSLQAIPAGIKLQIDIDPYNFL